MQVVCGRSQSRSFRSPCLLTGCASRPEVGALLTNYQMSAGAKDHTILVATTRARDPRPGTYFGGERSQSVNYAKLTVAVPPTHVPGQD